MQEQNLRLAAEASKENLSQQLAEQQSALATAKQQVCAQLHSLAWTAQLMLHIQCATTRHQPYVVSHSVVYLRVSSSILSSCCCQAVPSSRLCQAVHCTAMCVQVRIHQTS